jgi:hypothetical protein
MVNELGRVRMVAEIASIGSGSELGGVILSVSGPASRAGATLETAHLSVLLSYAQAEQLMGGLAARVDQELTAPTTLS